MDKESKKIFMENEVIAIEILEKAGWVLHFDVSVEKAKGPGDRWPAFTSGGEFKIALLMKSKNVKPSGLKNRGRGRPPKKAAA